QPQIADRIDRALLALLITITMALGAQAAVRVHTWHSPILEDYFANTLRSAPRHAVLLGTGDHRLFGMRYAQAILGVRPDVSYIDPSLLARPWYLAQARQAVSAPINPVTATPEGHSNINTALLVKQLAATGRPIALTHAFTPRILHTWPTWPLGTCLIVHTNPDVAPPGPIEQEQRNLDRFQHLTLRALEHPADPWARDVLPAYPRPWLHLAQAFTAMNDPEGAARNSQRAQELIQRSEE
ncbi:MAG: hypothetical protein AAFX99_29515, partial [Myxococcota bacterium]